MDPLYDTYRTIKEGANKDAFFSEQNLNKQKKKKAKESRNKE